MQRNFTHPKQGHRPPDRAALPLIEQLLMLALIAIVVVAILTLVGGRVSAVYDLIDAGLLR